jgi:hypothetical protein
MVSVGAMSHEPAAAAPNSETTRRTRTEGLMHGCMKTKDVCLGRQANKQKPILLQRFELIRRIRVQLAKIVYVKRSFDFLFLLLLQSLPPRLLRCVSSIVARDHRSTLLLLHLVTSLLHYSQPSSQEINHEDRLVSHRPRHGCRLCPCLQA